MQGNSELTVQNVVAHEYSNCFKARFYRILCLHSIAIISRSHAVFSRDQPWARRPPSYSVNNQRLCDLAFDLWDKDRIVLNGCEIRLSASTRYDCLEAYDFVYYFLLERAVPVKKLETWLVDLEGLDWYPYDEGEENALEKWFSLIDTLRRSLQPTDIVDLVKNKTWQADSRFPSSKFEYMRDRGLFDLGADGDMDYFSSFQRFAMICNLPYSLSHRGSMLTPNKHCLWDTIRIKVGSPFKPQFKQKLISEAENLNLISDDDSE